MSRARCFEQLLPFVCTQFSNNEQELEEAKLSAKIKQSDWDRAGFKFSEGTQTYCEVMGSQLGNKCPPNPEMHSKINSRIGFSSNSSGRRKVNLL